MNKKPQPVRSNPNKERHSKNEKRSQKTVKMSQREMLHALFGEADAFTIARILNACWLDGEFMLVGVKRPPKKDPNQVTMKL